MKCLEMNWYRKRFIHFLMQASKISEFKEFKSASLPSHFDGKPHKNQKTSNFHVSTPQKVQSQQKGKLKFYTPVSLLHIGICIGEKSTIKIIQNATTTSISFIYYVSQYFRIVEIHFPIHKFQLKKQPKETSAWELRFCL